MRVVVVGGGIGGLSAAYDLHRAGHQVRVLEGSAQPGGKLRAATVAGVRVDVGAEAMLSRRPEGLALAAELGLDVVHPTSATSRLVIEGALHPLPPSLMGVPFDPQDLAEVLSPAGLARAAQEQPAEVAEDISVGDFIDARYGAEVTDRLVEPLLGGVYAGRARDISLRAAVPQLYALAQKGPLTPQLAELGARRQPGEPVFAGLAGGMTGMVDALCATGFELRAGAMVRDVRRVDAGYQVIVGATTSEETLTADAVVIAVPASPAARLLGELVPDAAAALRRIETASVAVVTMAFEATAIPTIHGETSGLLIPPGEGTRIKASTFSFAKWAWVREAGAEQNLLLMRTSLGRFGEETTLQASDGELVAWSLADLARLVGIDATPVDTHVQRWGGGLPQYRVGHLDLVAEVRAAVAGVEGLEVCGAAYDGVGIPAVIGSGRRAAAGLISGG